MKIQVLGSGCPTCTKLAEIVNKAVEQLGLKTEVEYLSGEKGIAKIVELGAVSSPVLAINGQIVMTGYSPDLDKIKQIIKASIEK